MKAEGREVLPMGWTEKGKGGSGKVTSSFLASVSPHCHSDGHLCSDVLPCDCFVRGVLGCNEGLTTRRLAKSDSGRMSWISDPGRDDSRSHSRKFPVTGWLSSNCLPAMKTLRVPIPGRENLMAPTWSLVHPCASPGVSCPQPPSVWGWDRGAASPEEEVLGNETKQGPHSGCPQHL